MVFHYPHIRYLQPAVSMLQTLNCNTISQYANHNRHLSELTDSIVERNEILNTQLNKIIRQLEDKARNNLRCRENEISIMRERSYRQIGGLTVLLIVLLLLILYCNTLGFSAERTFAAQT